MSVVKSRTYDLRLAIHDFLVASADVSLTDAEIVIERSGDIYAQMDQILATADRGIALHIEAAEVRNFDRNASELDLEVTVTLALWADPLRASDEEEETLSEQLIDALHDTTIGSGVDGASPEIGRMGFVRAGERPDPQWLIRVHTFELRLL